MYVHRRGPVFGFKRLHGFLKMPSEEVIFAIARDKKDWEELLKSDDMKPSNYRNNLHLLIQVLAEKVVGETSLMNQRMEICIPTTHEKFQQSIREQCSQILLSSFSSTSNNPRYGNSNNR